MEFSIVLPYRLDICRLDLPGVNGVPDRPGRGAARPQAAVPVWGGQRKFAASVKR
ncbi:hypothetical protein D3C78_1893460 [compost metagenome]